jgi:hypothetical protein
VLLPPNQILSGIFRAIILLFRHSFRRLLRAPRSIRLRVHTSKRMQCIPSSGGTCSGARPPPSAAVSSVLPTAPSLTVLRDALLRRPCYMLTPRLPARGVFFISAKRIATLVCGGSAACVFRALSPPPPPHQSPPLSCSATGVEVGALVQEANRAAADAVTRVFWQMRKDSPRNWCNSDR